MRVWRRHATIAPAIRRAMAGIRAAPASEVRAAVSETVNAMSAAVSALSAAASGRSAAVEAKSAVADLKSAAATRAVMADIRVATASIGGAMVRAQVIVMAQAQVRVKTSVPMATAIAPHRAKPAPQVPTAVAARMRRSRGATGPRVTAFHGRTAPVRMGSGPPARQSRGLKIAEAMVVGAKVRARANTGAATRAKH